MPQEMLRRLTSANHVSKGSISLSDLWPQPPETTPISVLLVPITYRPPLSELLPVTLTDIVLDTAAPSLSVTVTVTV